MMVVDIDAVSARNAMSFRAIGILLFSGALMFAATTVIFVQDAAAAKKTHRPSYGQEDLGSIQKEVDQAARWGHYNGYHTRHAVH
jgi:hypothetical protein